MDLPPPSRPSPDESEPLSVLRWRRGLVPSNVGVSYANSAAGPLLLSSASGCRVTDCFGRAYLDCVNNVAHIGHSHPALLAAAIQQLSTLNTNTRYLSSTLCEYAAALLSTFPAPLRRVYFVNSGSEANDLSLRLAMAASPGRRHVLCLQNAYHGSTVATVACSPYKFSCQAGQAPAEHIRVCQLPDAYHGVSAEEAVEDVRRQIESVHSAGGRVLALIHESSPSCAGQLLLPAGYLAAVYDAVRAAGGLCIADEVQSGLGRNGSTWWEFERHAVLPDVVTAGKALGGGLYPIAAVVTGQAVADCFTASGYEFFNTAAGTNAAAAVGLAVLTALRSEDSMRHAGRLGGYWLDGLRRLQSAHPLIGDVRGVGLFIGLEISQPGSTAPAAEEATWVVNRMRAMEDEGAAGSEQGAERALSGVLLSTDGPHHNVIKVKPPMCIQQADVDCMLRVLERALIECEEWRRSDPARQALASL